KSPCEPPPPKAKAIVSVGIITLSYGVSGSMLPLTLMGGSYRVLGLQQLSAARRYTAGARSGEGTLLCPAPLPGSSDPMAAAGLIGINSNTTAISSPDPTRGLIISSGPPSWVAILTLGNSDTTHRIRAIAKSVPPHRAN